MGVRRVGSTQNRRFDLQEAESGGADLTTMHVVTDGTASIQFYPESTGGSYGFMPVGWWVLNSP